MPEASIIVTAQDKYSSAIKAMSQVTRSFSKDQDDMERKLQRLTNTQHQLRSDLDASRKKLKELETAFAETGDEAVKLQADSERLKLDNIKRNLDLVTRGASAARREMEKTGDAFSRSADKGIRATGGLSDVMKGFATSGIGQMLSQTAQQMVGAYANSALGSDGGSIVSGALSSAVSGAAIGSMIAPGIGTAIGAAAGGVIGAANGALQVWQNEDEYFKSYYNGIIDQQAQKRASDLETGSSIAAGREKDLISFTTLFGGRRSTAERYLADLVDMANTTPFLYNDLTAMSKTLATYKYSDREILPVLTKIGDAGAALGMGTSDMTMVATALGRMKSSDKATLEYLNILNDRGIGAVGMLAEAKGMSVGDTYTAISKGEIKGGEAVEIILAALERSYAGSMAEQSKTFSGLTSTLEGMKQEMQNAYGQGYNEERKQGIRDEIDALSGPMGEAEKALNEHKGALAAYRENLQEQYTREAKSAVMTGQSASKIWDAESAKDLKKMGEEYKTLQQKAAAGDQEAMLKMASLEEQAEALAQAAYDNSEWASKELTAQEENTKAIRDLTGRLEKGIMLQYQVEKEGEKGRGAVANVTDYQVEEKTLQSGNTLVGAGSLHADTEIIQVRSDGSHAAGLNRVPYDGYAAILHQGERVLTAREARSADRGSGGEGFTFNHYGDIVVRQDSDIGAIAKALAEEFRQARLKGTF